MTETDPLSFWRRWQPYWVRIVIGCVIGIAGVVTSIVTGKWAIDNGIITTGMVLIALSAFSFFNGSGPGAGRNMGTTTSSSGSTRPDTEQRFSWFWNVFLVALPLTVIAVIASRVFRGG